MAVIVETGAQEANADSYISEADADTQVVDLYGATDTFAAATALPQTSTPKFLHPPSCPGAPGGSGGAGR